MLYPLDYTVWRDGIRTQPVAQFVYCLVMAGIDLYDRPSDDLMQSAPLFDFHSMEYLPGLMRIGVDDSSRGDT